MRTRVFLGSLAILCALVFVVPASAMNICGIDYVLFAKTKIGLEDGKVNITGNVGVNDVGGLLRIGARNFIDGTVTADNMFFGTVAKVTQACTFTTRTGGNSGPGGANPVCQDGITNPAPVPLCDPWPPAPVPLVPVNTNDQICPVDGALTLLPGTYGALNVKDRCVLTLDTTNPGPFNFESIRLEGGSITNGNNAIVNVKGLIVTESGVAINDVTMTSIGAGTFETIQIGNNSILTNVTLYAPNARCHLHQGGQYKQFEAVCVLITVEPITIADHKNPVCVCPPGFQLPVPDPNTCGLDAQTCLPIAN